MTVRILAFQTSQPTYLQLLPSPLHQCLHQPVLSMSRCGRYLKGQDKLFQRKRENLKWCRIYKLDHVIFGKRNLLRRHSQMRTWQSQELKKKIYKNDDNTGIFKEKLFKLRKVLDRAGHRDFIYNGQLKQPKRLSGSVNKLWYIHSMK